MRPPTISLLLVAFLLPAHGADNAAPATTPSAPAVFEDFTEPTPWARNIDSTGVWRIAGTWVGTGKNKLLPALAERNRVAGLGRFAEIMQRSS